MRALPRLILSALLVFAGTSRLPAQDAPAPDTPAAVQSPQQTLDQVRGQLDAIKKSLGDRDANLPLAELRSQAFDMRDQALQLAAGLGPQQQSLQAKLDVLGPAPEKGAPPEAAEVSAQRRQLDRQKASLDAQVKQAQLLAEESLQIAAQLADQRRNEFQARLASRTATPFSRAFWVDPMRSLPADMRRLRGLGDDLHDVVRQAWQPPNRTPLLACLACAVLLLGVVRWLLERGLLNLTRNRMPAGHLRRSALALAITLLTALCTGMAAQLGYLAINWNGILDDDLALLAQRVVLLVALSAYVAGLGRALLSCRRPSWRLPNLTDDEAQRLRPYPWLLAAAMLLLGVLELINHAIGASLPATVATRGAIALVISGLIGIGLLRAGYARRKLAAAGQPPPSRPVWVGLVTGLALLAAAVAWIGVAAGFIALAFFVAVNTLWIGVVVCSLYLLMHVINDGFELLLSPRGRNGQRLQQAFDLTPARLDQLHTVLSGITRALFVLLALATVVSRFGASPEDLFSSLGGIFGSLTLGELKLAPGNILKAMLVFALGLLAVRMVKRWLGEQLLPKTSLDPGLQNSMLTLLGYIGSVLVFVMALATLQVSLQNITWIASALSVGIGFGLQAIVQNFISGLILLAERPVKVGDWVSLSGVEGDIRRINVRATEIQMSDRSTMIVPNSQLITQNVRNVTLANAQGRVQFRLPMPLDTDASRVRQIVQEVFEQHPAILATPKPSTLLDNIEPTAMNFTCTGYVSSPRDVGGVRSDLLFALLERLREAKLPLSRPQDMVVRTMPLPAPDGGAP
ncbi:mechanosensitive ion channel protein MscS [Frateuria sp. Soil773]|uniref:DUF3772 domain-containing protein n=1 Tax=Frateuria sp. Soil773 TaxID=1736407 RepID=UPI0006FCD70B|nr:DUF3772 domain-containing protein [Frateuria sp. Soil773]KRE89340.1 mechanosensitive ion channel protein MscS [Frateuria sp. Soil773]